MSPNAIPNRAAGNQRFFSSSRQGNVGQPGFNRGGNTIGRQPQQGNVRPGFQNFGSANSGNVNRGSVPAQASRPPEYNQGTRGYVMPARPGYSQPAQPSQQAPNYSRGNSGYSEPARNEYNRPQVEQNQGTRGYVMPARPGSSQPAEPSRQAPTYSRGYPGNSQPGRTEYSRPPLNMQQPVVTPRARTYSAPAPPSRGSRIFERRKPWRITKR